MSCNILVTASTDCPQDCIASFLPSPETKIACTAAPAWADIPGLGGGQGGFASAGIPMTATANVAISAAALVPPGHGGQGGIMVTQTSTLVMTLQPTTSFTTGPVTSAASSFPTMMPTLYTNTPPTTSLSSTMSTESATASALSTAPTHKPFIRTTGGIVTVLLIVLLLLALAILAAYLWRRKKKQKSQPREEDQEAALRRDRGDWTISALVEVPLTVRQKRDRRALREWEANATSGAPDGDEEAYRAMKESREARLRMEADATGATQEVKDSFDPMKNLRGGLPGELETRAKQKAKTERKWKKEAKRDARSKMASGGVGGTDEQNKMADEVVGMMDRMQGIEGQGYDPDAPRGPPPRPDKHMMRAMILEGEADRKAARMADREAEKAESAQSSLPMNLSNEESLPARQKSSGRRQGPPRVASPSGPKPPPAVVTIETNQEIQARETDFGWGLVLRAKKVVQERVEKFGPGRSPPPVASNEEIGSIMSESRERCFSG